MTSNSAAQPQPMPRGRALFLRVVLAAITAFLAVNLYTGAPLFAIWCGSRVQNGTQLTMGTVGVVIGVLVATVAAIVFLLTRVEAAYKAVTGQQTSRRTPPWLRSMRGERDEEQRRRPLTGYEKALVFAVVGAAAAFEIWFFFFSGSPIG
jgi:MFS superfamily sulfate permease-like transporter